VSDTSVLGQSKRRRRKKKEKDEGRY